MARRPTSTSPTPASLKSPGEIVYLAVGKLHRPHGLRGEIRMEVLTDFPERLVPGMTLYLGPGHQTATLLSSRWHKHDLLVAFEGYQDREGVAVLRNQLVQVRADDRPQLPEGEYYHHQLLGLRVLDEAGNTLGELAEILVTGANDVYVVRAPRGEEVLLPAIDSVVLDVDLKRGLMRVHLLPGILPEP